MKECILYDRECIECGECNLCDLDNKKICDNCCKCIQTDKDFEVIKIDKIIVPKKINKKLKLKK